MKKTSYPHRPDDGHAHILPDDVAVNNGQKLNNHVRVLSKTTYDLIPRFNVEQTDAALPKKVIVLKKTARIYKCAVGMLIEGALTITCSYRDDWARGQHAKRTYHQKWRDDQATGKIGLTTRAGCREAHTARKDTAATATNSTKGRMHEEDRNSLGLDRTAACE